MHKKYWAHFRSSVHEKNWAHSRPLAQVSDLTHDRDQIKLEAAAEDIYRDCLAAEVIGLKPEQDQVL